MQEKPKSSFGSNFRHFFVRGLGVLLPTVLTIWILIAGYRFVQGNIAEPINEGVRELIVLLSPWPEPETRDFVFAEENITRARQAEWRVYEQLRQAELGEAWTAQRAAQERQQWLGPDAKRAALERWWASVRIGTWPVLDVVGLIIAIVLIYIAGALLGGYIGNRIVRRGEEMLNRVPLIRSVYPSVKQVTDFIVGSDKSKLKFSRVVAVQYPRKGLWSIGLVTGDTMQTIQTAAGVECLTVFIPSSPTPFTGYVITVPATDTIDLPISIEEALKFTVSGGVLIPPSQVIARPHGLDPNLPTEPRDARRLPAQSEAPNAS